MRSLSTVVFLVSVICIWSSTAVGQVCTPVPIGLISSFSGENNTLDARSRYNGTIQNGVTYTAGKVGQALNLAGNNGDRVLLGNSPDLWRQNFTIEAWVKRTSSSVVTNSPAGGSPNGSFFAFGQSGYAFLLDQNTNRLGLSAVGNSVVFAPTLAITDTNWHHVAVTVSGPAFTAGTQTIFYLDGVGETTGYSPQYNFTTNAAIGSRGDGVTTNAFFGAIDELAIYDRPLALEQIQNIFNADTAGKCKPLATNAPDNQVLWLAGDGDALDSTGNGNNGTLQNGAAYAVGRVGQGFMFDGVDDHITITDNANQNGGTSLTIEAWINPTSLPHGGTILQKRTNANVGGYLLETTQPSGGAAPNGLQFVIMIGGVYSSLNPANIVVPNVWQHVAATYDGAFMRIYVNGVEVGNKPQTGAIDNIAAPVVIGRNVVVANAFPGRIDEASLFSRALSAAEIQSISNAGLGGKYKAQATVPANVAAWYPGDGNTNDFAAGNTATLQGTASYTTGKVGSAFSVSNTGYVSAPSIAGNDPTGTTGASMEAWVYFNQRPSDAGRPFWIISKDGPTFGSSSAFHLRTDTDNGIKFQWQGGGVGNSSNFTLQTGVWYHVVGTYSPTEPVCKMYINGVFQGNGACTSTPRTPSNLPLEIGRYSGNNSANFDGLIDEPAIYNRALSEAEIRDQYHVGSSGKYKMASNPTVGNKAKYGDATTTFTGVTTSGSSHQTPIDITQLPPLPVGATSVGLTYDIAASVVSGTPYNYCFQLPGLSSMQFANLGILHLESGVWIDRATSRNSLNQTICGSSTTLSPFALAEVLVPTSASANISGRVTTAQGPGISNLVLTLSGSNGVVRTARTSTFGYYSFEGLSTGQTYVVSVQSKRHVFAPSTRVVSLDDEVTGIDFQSSEVGSQNRFR
ncbi:MAG TPA: carboxypeptidase regulatory-like domain-containing protein [Pyrinomonadaceae bacterium]|nr:carboxypeptidase regulatory-like domain-containing protein [Pyrinomonadaceae bacterium]